MEEVSGERERERDGENNARERTDELRFDLNEKATDRHRARPLHETPKFGNDGYIAGELSEKADYFPLYSMRNTKLTNYPNPMFTMELT